MFYFCAGKRDPVSVLDNIKRPVFENLEGLTKYYKNNPLPNGYSLICFEGDLLDNGEYQITFISKKDVDLAIFDNYQQGVKNANNR